MKIYGNRDSVAWTWLHCHAMMLRPGFWLSLALLVACYATNPALAGPVFWDYPTGTSFEDLDLQGVALDQYGRLIAGLASETIATEGPEIFWSVIPDGRNGFFAGSGHSGQIWKITGSGEAELFTTVPEPEVFSLLSMGKHLFAGGGPNGLLYRCSDDGEAEVWADLNESYIWALAAGQQGEIYLASGSPASIYRVSERFEVEQLVVLPATNALDLAMTEAGYLLVATQGPGLVYRVDLGSPDQPVTLFESEQEEVRQLVPGPDGAWYALALSRESEQVGKKNQTAEQPDLDLVNIGFSQNGNTDLPVQSALYRIDAGGMVTTHWAGKPRLLSVAHSATWDWIAAGVLANKKQQAALLLLEPPGMVRPLASWDSGDVLDLLVQPGQKGKEEIIACLAQPGRLLRLRDRPAESALAVSEPVDGGQPIRWGRLRWEGQTPKDSKLRWSVRGGARSVPDQTWTEWSATWPENDHIIPLPPSRFLQWRVEFTGQGNGANVTAVTVSGFEPNSAPLIFQFELLDEGEMTTGGMLSRDENVTETFSNGLKAEYSMTSKRSRRADLTRAAPARPLRTFTWLARDPNDDRLEYRLDYQRIGEETWRPVGPTTSEVVGSWNTSTVPDGMYVMRLTASDQPGNPHLEALSSSRTTAPFTVDHTPPQIEKFLVQRTPTGFSIGFSASDQTSPLAEAWLELPDGRVERLDPSDGVCDSRTENFEQQVSYPRQGQALSPEPWRVRVEVADLLGNVAAEEGEAR